MITDAKSMTVRLTDDRKANLRECGINALKERKLMISDLAKAVVKIVVSFLTLKYGPLHDRHLEETNKAALQKARSHYNSPACLSPHARGELHWWADNVDTAHNDITPTDLAITVASDASLSGWGCVCGGYSSGGLWMPVEARFHISYLELKAAFFALKCFKTKIAHKHVHLLLDETTAVACINNMGTSHSDSCNDITFCIWQWCQARHIWLSAAYIPRKSETELTASILKKEVA